MIRDVIQSAGQIAWPVIALLIMLIAFIAILVWTFSGKKNRFEGESNLPLQDEDDDITHSHTTRGVSS